jgi:hypothetical protein
VPVVVADDVGVAEAEVVPLVVAEDAPVVEEEVPEVEEIGVVLTFTMVE